MLLLLWLEDCPLRLLLHQLGQSSSRVHGKLLRICAFVLFVAILFSRSAHPKPRISIALSRLQKHSSLAKPRQRNAPKGEVP